MRASWLLFRTLALSHLATHRLRVALSGVGISLGVMLLFAALIGNGSLTQSFADTRRSLYGTPDIEVLGASPGGIDEAMLAQAARTPGVAVASPLLVERTLAKGPSRAAEVIVVGFDNRLLAQAPAAANPKQLRLVGRGVGLTVPQQLLDELGVTGTGDMRLGILADGVLHRIPVVAVAPPALGAQLNGGHAVGVPLQLAQQIFHQPGRLSAIGIKTQPHWRAATVYTSLSYLFDNNADVVFGNEQQRELDAATSQQRGLTNFLSLLALLLGAMVLYSTMSMTAVERRREFAIMLALGESPTALLLRFLGEAAVIGLFGSAVGLAGGWLLGHYLVGTTPRFIEDAYGFSTRFIVPTWAPLTAFAGGVLMAVLAAAVPALGLRRIPPAEALRPQAVGEPAPDRRLRVVATLVGTVLAAGGLLATLVAPRVGLQGVSVMFLGMALVAPAVLSVVVRAVARALIRSRFRGAAGVAQIAAADLVQAPGRTVAAASAVAFALGMVLALGSMADNVSTMVNRFVDAFGPFDLAVNSSQDLYNLVPLDPQLAARIKALPEVAHVSDEYYTFYPWYGRRVFLLGLDPALFGQGHFTFTAGDPKTAPLSLANHGMVVSTQMVTFDNLRVGQLVPLRGPAGLAGFRVTGVDEDPGWDEGVVAIGSADFARWLQQPAPNQLFIQLRPGADVSAMRTQIRSMEPGLQVQRPADFHNDVAQNEAAFFSVFFHMRNVCILVAALAVFNTLLISVLQRRREIGVLSAVGLLPGQLVASLVLQATLMATIGLAFGVVIGLTIQAVGLHYIVALYGIPIHWALAPGAFALAITAAAVISVSGSAYPARQATRVPILEAIAYE